MDFLRKETKVISKHIETGIKYFSNGNVHGIHDLTTKIFKWGGQPFHALLKDIFNQAI
jgi:hypothetical protein